MKKLSVLLLITFSFMTLSCKKESKSERFIMLTTPVWTTVTLLANGVDASGPGGLLASFVGDAKFNENGTGYFGINTGQWWLNSDETELSIYPDSPRILFTCIINQLTSSTLEVTTTVQNISDPQNPITVQMTFRAK